jgi:hypothetical protein
MRNRCKFKVREVCEITVVAYKVVRSVLTDVVYEVFNGMVRYAPNNPVCHNIDL